MVKRTLSPLVCQRDHDATIFRYTCSFLLFFTEKWHGQVCVAGVERAVINLILNLGIRIISAAINSHFNPWRSKSRNDENGDTRVSVYRRNRRQRFD